MTDYESPVEWFRYRVWGWPDNDAYPRWRSWVCWITQRIPFVGRHVKYDSWYGPHNMGDSGAGPNEGVYCRFCGESWRA